ncbi:biotin--[acetyl-CoA-carboxylase] ligase [Chryseobacterium suipulveris]|uniref:Biotin--[acetyl-CoA-carboxylase] ligase n=1 Tax=Chryseobacterium suipulveris TaxID=2929800 RepID=A0ABY4BUF4_9FLAO|nr:biotin--[acetyl-CoA-carboxylase] ligase [Chryseobacterium suipulveris]UOE41336.1 biotin--[acetyl-CoA-carboxylase] ligase [Chryseobacterium suipulveris]
MTPVFYLKECSSTNDEIDAYLLYEKAEILAVYTFNQTKGKGQYGNSWISPKNMNLAYSLAIPAEKIKVRENLFNFRTATVLRDYLANLTKVSVEIKWPNDLIVGNKKISGILIEKKNIDGKPYFIIGIGVNVLQQDFENLPKAGSLLTQTGVHFDLVEFADQLHQYLVDHLTKEKTDTEILEQVNDHLFRKNVVSVFEVEGIRQNGIIRDVDEDGFLWVELENGGLQKFFHKEIEMLY